SSPDRLEGNVVVAGAAAGGGGTGREVLVVHGHVALGGEAVAGAGVVATPEELHRVGDDLNGLTLAGAVLGLPLAPLQAPVDGHRAALGQVLGAVLALLAPHGHIEVVRLVDPFARRVLPPRVARDAQAADGGAAGQRAQLGVAGQVSGE